MASMVPGSNAALTAENPHLTRVLVGLGWGMTPSRGPQAEPVPLAIMCGKDGRALSDEHLVFFNQISTSAGGLEFVGTEDQEQIDVVFSLIPEAVSKIAFLVYVDPEVRGPGTFAAVKDSYIRVANEQDAELLRFTIPPQDQSRIKAMMFGELYRHGANWKFRALGQGYQDGLAGVARDFGLVL
ncbi:chemical-damaging agent resistance protein C [Arthrobacter pityocampae]|uniref:Chemical-damaging agent resistance protein C n=2 Tax=Arthrobacter pityocampae TaxID=547334 RepID=A0A2S5IU19_9MICC|nr:chemical-damaging agent resistance protein C [Arthrobacter pityocampae]